MSLSLFLLSCFNNNLFYRNLIGPKQQPPTPTSGVGAPLWQILDLSLFVVYDTSCFLVMFIVEFFLNVFSEFPEFSDKKNCHYSKRIQTPATSCVRDQHATTAPAQHM